MEQQEQQSNWLSEMRAKYFPSSPTPDKIVEQEQQTSYHKYINPDYQLPRPQFKPTEIAKSIVDFDGLFNKVVQAESGGVHIQPDGSLTKSKAGAKGITQLMPKTAEKPGYGIEPVKDESESEYLRVGKSLLKAYTEQFEGDVVKGLAAYNWGPGNLSKLIKKHGVNWRDALPDETSKYLSKILGKSAPQATEPDYGFRVDGTKKGNGFFGPLKMTNGSTDVMTEVSIGVNIDGKDVEIPSLVPTLSKSEVDLILSGAGLNEGIVNKAVEHARKRISEGKSPFAGKEDIVKQQEKGDPLKATHAGKDQIFNKGLNELVSSMKGNTEFEQLHGWLLDRKAVPNLERGFGSERGSFEYSAYSEVPDPQGTIKVNSYSPNPKATLIHEMTHAAERQMRLLHTELSKKKELTDKEQQFIDAWDKSFRASYDRRTKEYKTGVSDIIKALDAKWLNANKDYRTSNTEIPAQAMGSVSGAKNRDGETAPQHADPSIATEFMMMVEMARQLSKKKD